MKKLLQKETINTLIKHPERLEVLDLLAASHQVFIVQGVVGFISFVNASSSDSIGLETIGNVLVPLLGFYHTQDFNPENFRTIRLCAIYWFFGLIFAIPRALFLWQISALLICVLKSVVFGIQWMALARLWRMLQDRQMSNVQFFLNVVIKNKDEVVKAKAKEKNARFGGLLGNIANKVVTKDKFAKTIGEKLEISIPEKMSEKGIVAKATKKFHQGNLIVVLVEIENVDIRQMVEQKLGANSNVHNYVDFFMNLIPKIPARFRAKSGLEQAFFAKVASGLMAKLPEQMANQMKELGGLEVEVHTCSKEEESEFLFAALKKLEEEKKKHGKENDLHPGEEMYGL